MEQKTGKCEGPIKKGTALITAKPFAYVLSSEFKNERCDNCLSKRGKLFKCSGCQYVYYCDRNCQRESWKVHKFECSNLKRVSPKIVPDAARLMARIIIKLNQGGADERGYYSEGSYRKFKDLMSHYTDVKNDERRMEHFVSLCGVLLTYLEGVPMPNSAELMGIYGRICVNAFNILDQCMNSIGAGIYLGPSILDHSCKPNVTTVFEGTTIIIRALEDLPCLDWSQIRISYIDILNTTKDRRKELQDTYYFQCNCERCQEPEPTVEAAACPNPSCTYACPSNSIVCKECGTKMPEKFNEKFDEVSEFTAHHLQEMSTMAYLDVCKMCLKLQNGVLHPLNIQHVRTLEAAVEASIKLKRWEETESYTRQLLPGYIFYHGEVSPLTGLLYLQAANAKINLQKRSEAIELMKKAKSILTITHGERHTVMKENVLPVLCVLSGFYTSD